MRHRVQSQDAAQILPVLARAKKGILEMHGYARNDMGYGLPTIGMQALLQNPIQVVQRARHKTLWYCLPRYQAMPKRMKKYQ